jgi:riboflavin kinase/FMN adenylyltransferase
LNLLKFLRDEKKFTGVPDLAEQIGRDAEEAKKVLSANKAELLASCTSDLGVLGEAMGS